MSVEKLPFEVYIEFLCVHYFKFSLRKPSMDLKHSEEGGLERLLQNPSQLQTEVILMPAILEAVQSCCVFFPL